MPTLKANGVGLHVSRYASQRARRDSEPEPPVVVFIHGLMVDHAAMGFMFGLSMSKVAEVVLYDLRGHGRSEPVTSGYHLADHVADLAALLDELGLTEPVHLAGGSYGGAVATVTAMQHPERVASLSLIEGLVPHEGWGAVISSVMERAAESLSGDVTAEEAMEALGMSSPRRALGVAKRARRLILETTLLDDVRSEIALKPEDYAALDIPVLGIYGDCSDVYPVTSFIKEAPAAEIHTVPGADHFAVFRQTHLVKTLISEHIGAPLPDSSSNE